VSARLVAVDGRPLAGQLVWPAGVDAFAFAGADGFVRLTLRPPADRTTLGFVAEADAVAAVRVRVPMQVGAWTDLGAVTLPPIAGLTGTVVDENGRPVPDAVVFCGPAAVPDAGERDLGPATEPDFVVAPQRVGVDGGFRLARVPAVPLRVWAVAPLRAFVASGDLTPAPGPDRVLEPLVCRPLPAHALAAVTVVDEAGRLVPAARVRMHRTRPRLDPSGVLGARWFEAGADGRVAFVAQQLEVAAGAVAVVVLAAAR
jgi:hypothetical protein